MLLQELKAKQKKLTQLDTELEQQKTVDKDLYLIDLNKLKAEC